MSSNEHQATVDTGLKMKIVKRKNVSSANKLDSLKHEIVKSESASEMNIPLAAMVANGATAFMDKAKHGLSDKSLKVKGAHKKEKLKEKCTKNHENGTPSGGSTSGCQEALGVNPHEPKLAELPNVKKENTVDPYEFNAKVEDGIGLPYKKSKVEKLEAASSPISASAISQEVSTETCCVSSMTDPECLGPCEPGTSVTLEGIVWQETENGVLVINVTWRGKTYVGTLLDATRHDWAPPRLNCDSPMSDIDNKTPKGRGKRGRGAGTPINERVVINEGRKLRKNRRTSNGNPFQAPPSPAKSDISSSGPMKRKGRPPELDFSLADLKPSKRSRSSSRGMTMESPSSTLIECPEPKCNKKYKHINGLRYHQTHAHQNQAPQEDLDPSDNKDEEMADDTSICEDDVASKSDVSEGQVTSGKSSTKNKDTQSKSNPVGNTESSLSPNKESASDANCDSKMSNSNNDTVKNLASNSSKKEAISSAAKECAVSSSSAVSTSSPTVVTTAPTSNTTVPTQLFQISSAAMGGAALVSQAASHSAPVTMVHSSSPNSTPLPVAIATIPQPAEMAKSETVFKVEQRVTEKPKCKSATRPIVPAPSPQIVALSSAVNVSHSNLSPVSTHAQMSPSLKPIQPKPTIMGEPTNINPALVGLKAEKKAKQKKKSVRDKDIAIKPSKDGHGKLIPVRSEHPGVIKPVPAKSLEGKKDSSAAMNASKIIPEVQKLTAGGSITTGRVSPKMPDGNRPIKAGQSLLKVNSSLQVVTHENKTPISDDVQSPAYSDISDANEGCSPSQGDSPQKSKEIPCAKKDDVPNPDGSGVPPHYYGYYGHGQSPYMSPGAVNSAHMSPGNISASHMSPNAQRNVGTPQRTATATIGSKDSPSLVSDSKKQTSGKDPKKPHEREKSLEKDENKQKQDAPLSQQQMQQQEYLQQQKWHQQQMYALQTMPQYQYLASYGYGVDPAYHMHMASDPNYHKQLAEEQKRYHQEMLVAKGDEGKIQGRRSPADMVVSPTDLSDTKASNAAATVQRNTEKMEPKKAAKKAVEKESKDQQSLKDKQNENHQIIKENIELKSQMDKASLERNYDPYSHHRAPDKHQEELRRYYFFEQQKHMEQQRNEENQKLENSGKSESRLLETPSKLPGSKPIPGSAGSAHKVGHGEESRSGTVRKDAKDIKSKELVKDSPVSQSHKSGDSKTSDNKVKSDHPFDKNRSPTDSKKGHRTNFGPIGSPHTPSASPVAASTATAPYPGSYPPYPSYMQNSQYGHVQYDQSVYRQMNPSAMNYPGGYIHPSQMAYRIGEGDEKEKAAVPSVPTVHKPPPAESTEPKGDSGHGTPFHSGHKLHELQVAEKRRPRSRNSPSTPKNTEAASTQSADKHREYSSSPPTQRHVHTHHHTHVVGAYPPIYDPYEVMFASPKSSSTPAPVTPHSFKPK